MSKTTLSIMRIGVIVVMTLFFGSIIWAETDSGYQIKSLRVNKIILSGDSSFVIETDIRFNERSVQIFAENLLDELHDLGYYWAVLNSIGAELNGQKVSVRFELTKGPAVRFSELHITGIDKSSARLVRKQIDIKKDQLLTDELVKSISSRADNITFVRRDGPISVIPESGYNRAAIEIPFLRLRSFNFSGGGGYIPDDPDGIVWNVDLKVTNFIGGGRQVGLKSERRNRGRTWLQVNYAQPLFLFGNGSFDMTIATRDYREQFYEFAIDAALRSAISVRWFWQMSLGWKRVDPASINPTYSRLSFGTRVGFSSLDSKQRPHSGLFAETGVTYAYRNQNLSTDCLDCTESSNDARLRADIDYYLAFTRLLGGHFGLKFRSVETSDDVLPEAEMFYVGGPGTLRGFRNEQFLTNKYAVFTFEPRLSFDAINLIGFYDLARISVAKSLGGEVNFNWQTETGIGLGVELFTAKRSIALSLGWDSKLGPSDPRLSILFSSTL